MPRVFAHRCSPLSLAATNIEPDGAQRLARASTECVRLLHLPSVANVRHAFVAADLDNLYNLLVKSADAASCTDVSQPLLLLHVSIHACELHEAAPARHDNGFLGLVCVSAAESGRTVVCLLTEAQGDVESVHVRAGTQAILGGLCRIKVAPWWVVVLLFLRGNDEDVGHLLHGEVLGWGRNERAECEGCRRRDESERGCHGRRSLEGMTTGAKMDGGVASGAARRRTHWHADARHVGLGRDGRARHGHVSRGRG